MTEPFERLQIVRAQAGYANATDAARAFGWNENTYRSHENGERGLKPAVANRYAKAFRVSSAYLLTGESSDVGPTYVRVVGLVGAGGQVNDDVTQVHQNQVVRVKIDIPLPDGLSAFEVWGDSMLPKYDPGDLIIVQDHPVPVSQVLGDVALVTTANGSRYVKRILRGSEPGLYTLESYNASPMEDVEIREVGMIYLILPRRQVQIVHDDAPAPKRALRKPNRIVGEAAE